MPTRQELNDVLTPVECPELPGHASHDVTEPLLQKRPFRSISKTRRSTWFAAIELKDVETYSEDPFFIKPGEPLKAVWDGLVYVLMLYSAVSLPITVAYEVPDWAAAEVALSIVFAADIALKFRTGFVDEFMSVCTDAHIVAKKYASSWLFCDVIAAVPWVMVANAALGADCKSCSLAAGGPNCAALCAPTNRDLYKAVVRIACPLHRWPALIRLEHSKRLFPSSTAEGIRE